MSNILQNYLFLLFCSSRKAGFCIQPQIAFSLKFTLKSVQTNLDTLTLKLWCGYNLIKLHKMVFARNLMQIVLTKLWK